MKNKIKVIFIGMLLCATLISVAESEKINDSNQNNTESLDSDWWNMLYHDAERSGFSTLEGPETNNILWESTNWGLTTAPIVADDIIYSAGFGGFLFAFNAYTGEKLKAFDKQTNAPLAASDGKIYVILTNKSIVCLDAENNWEQEWIQSEAIDGSTSFYSPIISENKLYIAYMNSQSLTTNISCLNIENGTVFWEYSLDTFSFSDIVISNGNVYVTANRDLFCIDATDGDFLWQTTVLGPADQFVGSTPTISNGKLYTISSNGKVYGLDLTNNGAIDWEYDTGDLVNIFDDSPSIAYGRLYIGTAANLYCFNISSTSIPEWIYNDNDIAAKTPIVADGKVYVNQNGLRCLDAFGNGDGTTTLLWEFASTSTVSPCIGNDILYIVNSAKLFAFHKNQAPEIPTITGDDRAIKNEPFSLYVNTTDPDNDSIFYIANWGDDSGQQTFGPYPSGVEQVITHIYTKPHTVGNRTFDIRVKAREDNLFSFESGIAHHYVTVENHAPDVPDVDGPTLAVMDEEFIMEITIDDPDGDNNLAYRWKKFPQGWGSWTGNYDSGTTAEVPVVIQTTGNYTLMFQVGERASNGGLVHARSEIANWSIEIVNVGVEIGNITAEFGVINAEIMESKGGTNAENVQWTIDVIGGVFGRVNVEADGTIETIPVGGSETVSTRDFGKFFGFIFGLGPVNINVSAICDGLSQPAYKEMQANLLGPIVLNLREL